MKICVDKRTELMAIVLALAQGNEYLEEHFLFKLNDPYRDKVYKHFVTFKTHKCVKLAKKIAQNDVGFSYDNPIRLAFAINENLLFNGMLEEYFKDELKNIDLAKEFLYALTDFAKDSKFVSFFNKNRSYYKEKCLEIEKLLNKKVLILEFESLLKKKIKQNFIVNIVPMLINANHGFKINNKIIANIGLLSQDSKTIDKFNNGYSHIIIHEFCHNFVNLNTLNLKISDSFIDKLKAQDYKNPKAYLNDTIVRAMTIRINEKISNINVKKFLDSEHEMGFGNVKKVYEEIIKYEKQNVGWRDYFPNFINIIIN